MSSFPESYLPSLMEIVQADPSTANRVNPICGICTEPMTVDEDVPNVNLIPYYPKIEKTPHAAFVLPCGHIFGLSCAEALLDHDEEHQKQHKCPTCRFVLSCSSCWDKGIPGGHNKGVLLSLSQDKRERMLEVLDAVLKLPATCLPCFMVGIAKTAQRLPPVLEVLVPDLLSQKVTISCKRDNEGWKIARLNLKGIPKARLYVAGFVERTTIDSQYLKRDRIHPQLRDKIENALNLYMKVFEVFSWYPERDCIRVECSQTEGIISFVYFELIGRHNIGNVVRQLFHLILNPNET